MERALGSLPLEVQGGGVVGAIGAPPGDSDLVSLLQAWFERSTGRVNFGVRNELSLAMLDRFREAEGLTFDEGE